MGKHADAARGRQPKAQLLVALYALSEERVAEMIRSAQETKNLRQLRSRRRRIVIEIRDLLARTSELAEQVLRSAFGIGQAEAERKIGKREHRPLSATDTRALDVLIDNLTGDLRSAAILVGRRADDIFRRTALQAAVRELETETPAGVSADQAVRELQRQGITGFVDKAGRRWRLSTYAQMAVRTTSAQALAEGTRQKMLERGFDLVEISSHGCRHHDDPENPCRRLEGKTLSLTGRTPGYEQAELPPYHPQCQHFISPSAKNFEVPAPEPVAT